MPSIAESLVTLIEANETIQDLGIELHYAQATRESEYPYITYIETVGIPTQLHAGGAADDQTQVIVETRWDFKVWGTDSTIVNSIYQELANIFNKNDLDGYIGLVRGPGLPMETEVNAPDGFIYSRIIECSVYAEE